MHNPQQPNTDPPDHQDTANSQASLPEDNLAEASLPETSSSSEEPITEPSHPNLSPEEQSSANIPPAQLSSERQNGSAPVANSNPDDSSDQPSTDLTTTDAPVTTAPSARATTQGQLNWSQFATLTDQGKVRERNEDRVWVEAWPDKSAILAVVADGMGGNRGGAEAAEIAINTFRELLEQPLSTAASDRYEQLLGKFHEADERIRDRGCQSFHLLGMGATIVAAIITDSECLHLYAGDSRLYHWRDRTIEYYTADHSIVRILIDIGKITESESLTHPMRSAINSCLGGRGDSHLSVDPKWDPPVNAIADDLPGNGQSPVSPVLTLQLGDLLLFSTDGLHGLMVNQDIQDALQALPPGNLDPSELVSRLADLALEKGGSDNITLAAIALHTPS